MTDNSAVPCYIARCLCGCGNLVYAAVDLPEYRAETARSLATQVKAGYVIERSTVGATRAATWGCAHKQGV